LLLRSVQYAVVAAGSEDYPVLTLTCS